MPSFLIRLRPSRADMLASGPTPEESAAIASHFTHLQAAAADGTLWFAGRTDTAGPDTLGIAVVRAPDAAAAQKFLDADPAVRAGVFRGDVAPFRIAIRSDTWSAR